MLLSRRARSGVTISTALQVCSRGNWRKSHEPDVRSSVKRVYCVKSKRSAHIFIPYERSIILVFRQGWWEITTSTWNFEPNRPRRFRNADFQSISAHSASAVITPSERSWIMTNRNSTTGFSMSLTWTEYAALSVRSSQHTLINAKWRFCVKSALLSKKVCYKVSLCENCQRQSCKAFTGLSIRAEIVAGGRPLLHEKFGRKRPTPFKFLIDRSIKA